MSMTRAIKFEVVFPGLRNDDRSALYKKLWGLQSDLTRAANRVISALWLVDGLGQLAHPVEPPARKPNDPARPVPLATLAYRGMNGSWQPFGKPCYEPYNGNPAAAAGVLCEIGATILTRHKTDKKDILAGKQSIATFREIPVSFRGQDYRVREDGCFELTAFGIADKKRSARVVIRPRKLDNSQNEILHRCRSGQYKTGSARLWWSKREGQKGKWLFSMSWTDEGIVAVEAPEPALEPEKLIIAGIDTGIRHAAWIAFCEMDGSVLPKPAIIQFPSRTLRAVVRISKERKERSEFNREALGLREGRGRVRKMRVVEKIGDKVERMNETMVEQMAASAIEACKKRGAKIVVLEDHGDWSVDNMHGRADRSATKSEAAKIRASYFRWHQGAMREALKSVAEREGLRHVEINPAWTSRTCHECGVIHKKTGMYAPSGAPESEKQVGRVSAELFACTCGYRGQADHNAAINIAKLGLRVINGENEPVEIAPVRGAKKKKSEEKAAK